MSRVARTVAVVAVVSLFAGACTGTAPAGGSDRRAGTTATPTEAARFELDGAPLWRGTPGGLPAAAWDSARFVGDMLFLEDGTSPVAVVNPRSGKPYWTAAPALLVGNRAKYGDVELAGFRQRAPFSRVRGEWAMFVNYRTGFQTDGAARAEWVAAVRATDARPLWRVPAPSQVHDLMAADDRIVLLSLGSRRDRPAARALNAADGSARWEAPGVWPRFLAGDRVLGDVSSQPPDLAAADSYVVGLDAATGKRTWSLEGRYPRSAVGLVAGDVALVYVRKTDRDEIVLVNVAIGAELDRLGWDLGAQNACAADGDRLIACTVDEGGERIATYDVARRAKHLGRPSHFVVGQVSGEFVFASRKADGTDDVRAVDRDGVVVSDRLPGTLIGVSDEFAVFQSAGDHAPALYRRR